MTKKERVLCAIKHQKPNRIPKSDSFWEDTLSFWYEQGLSQNIPVYEFFDFDIVTLSIDASPRFSPKLLKQEVRHDETYLTFQDRMGYICKKIKGKSRTLDYISYPVSDQKSWQNVKPMFKIKPDEKARIDDKIFPFRLDDGPTWKEVRNKYQKFQNNDFYLLAGTYGPHEAAWRFHGFTETLIDLKDKPDFIEDIASTYIDFLIKVIKECLAKGIKFDGFLMIDDIASSNGLLFSPEIWRKIYKPLIEKLGDFLHQNKIHFWLHCCGNAQVLFDDFIDCGIQVINPLEAKSGLNVAELKDKYGNRLTFFGNIDVQKMSLQDQNLIEDEIKNKLSLFRNGGYIYHSDHSIPPEVSFEQYKFVMDLMKKYGSF